MKESYMKYGRSYYQARDCKTLSRAKIPSFPENTNQEIVLKKRKFDNRQLMLTELGSKEDQGKE